MLVALLTCSEGCIYASLLNIIHAMASTEQQDQGYVSSEDEDFDPTAVQPDEADDDDPNADSIAKHVVEEPDANILANVITYEKEQAKHDDKASSMAEELSRARANAKASAVWEEMKRENGQTSRKDANISITAATKKVTGKKRKTIMIVSHSQSAVHSLHFTRH